MIIKIQSQQKYSSKIVLLVLLLTFLFLLSGCDSKPTDKTNILLILVDDMGFSDLGCFGSEISTPHIDQLAADGLRFTGFYNGARCCPTRASLLTGLYSHQAGMGAMISRDAESAEPGAYQGFLNNQCVTLAEVLKMAGYQTYMSGKWHVGENHPQWPMDRGFDDYYGLISGAANYFDIRKTKKAGVVRHFAKGNEEHMPPTGGWYMTDALTDNALRMLDQAGQKDEPFFLYLAYTAPHWPLHALPEDIAKYRGKYKIGWDKIREQRHRRQIEMSLFDKSYHLTPRDSIAPAWETLSEEKKDEMDLKMAVYAAQMESMDRGVGKVMQKLKQLGQKENTLVLFLSDNGACAEGGVFGQDFWNNGVPPGGKDGYHNYGLAWANASNTPFRKYKQYTHEGGIRTPFIANWPNVIKAKGEINHQPAHIIDVMNTFCEIAGVNYPETYRGQSIHATAGKSLLPMFSGQERTAHEQLCWEHIGSVGIRKGDWKLVAARMEPWELYDLSADPTELKNLIEVSPDVAHELHQDWMRWAADCDVKIKDVHSRL